MNRQKEIVITVTYNELGIIVDTKAEPRKRGKWIAYYGDGEVPSCREVAIDEKGRIAILKNCYCSECDELLIGSDEYEVSGRYCPNCGAYMIHDERRDDGRL